MHLLPFGERAGGRGPGLAKASTTTHALEIRQYVIVPETPHSEAFGLEIVRACLVVVLLFEMLTAI